MSTPAWPPAERPSAESVRRREAVVDHAASGRLDAVRAFLADPDDRVRATALVALAGHDALGDADLTDAVADPSPRVRRAAARIGASNPLVELVVLLRDREASVCEMACWAAGERAEGATDLVEILAQICTTHAEPLCREAAVAALGAVGDPRGLSAILAATGDRATVRRRAVLALAPFDTPEVSEALDRALSDRDWQVRQAAEDLLIVDDEVGRDGA